MALTTFIGKANTPHQYETMLYTTESTSCNLQAQDNPLEPQLLILLKIRSITGLKSFYESLPGIKGRHITGREPSLKPLLMATSLNNSSETHKACFQF